ncbi:GNAT family N-acetyltransferase [Aurantiacibacter aquimixticola]|uniref:N-acetyltransferase n=1 Tax=Aurantiacibacter aquimixticola TaxID=1958945 RepID=A0A419RUX4_9SPHN|nr:GNAT family N-acetyltransferase [Aurantiacibacter aquimixticola]RJY09593.1 N-acetyltransferase [Aurantiacibacter aquimixticola]
MPDGAEPFRHETARLVLRDWRNEDWPEFWRLTNTPAVMRWLGREANAQTREAARARVERYARDYGHTFWALERMPDGGHLSGEILGFCGLKRANVDGSPVSGMPEIGWRLREDAWGCGYAKEAAMASLDLGFGRFGYDEIVALTLEGNAASWGLMKRLGMRRRKDLDYIDPNWPAEFNPNIVYSIAASAWKGADG